MAGYYLMSNEWPNVPCNKGPELNCRQAHHGDNESLNTDEMPQIVVGLNDSREVTGILSVTSFITLHRDARPEAPKIHCAWGLKASTNSLQWLMDVCHADYTTRQSDPPGRVPRVLLISLQYMYINYGSPGRASRWPTLS